MSFKGSLSHSNQITCRVTAHLTGTRWLKTTYYTCHHVSITLAANFFPRDCGNGSIPAKYIQTQCTYLCMQWYLIVATVNRDVKWLELHPPIMLECRLLTLHVIARGIFCYKNSLYFTPKVVTWLHIHVYRHAKNKASHVKTWVGNYVLYGHNIPPAPANWINLMMIKFWVFCRIRTIYWVATHCRGHSHLHGSNTWGGR